MILHASRLLADPTHFFEGGGVRLRRGRIVAVLRSAGAVRRARRAERSVDLGDGLLAPGLVNAHAHLELSGLRGELSAGAAFVPWIRAIVAHRRELSKRDLARAILRGARRALATGTTTLGDIAGTEASLAAPRAGLRTILYREVLDGWDPARTQDVLARVRRALPARRTLHEGLSPHAPYSTSRELLSGVASIAQRRRVPVTVHWSETEEESEWLEHGSGPLADLLHASPRMRGLELLAEAGLLGSRTSLVHGNEPQRGEPALLAERGAVLVHCPGSHVFFRRAPFPLRRYRRSGVRIALGTDSLASNEDLDMRREMALARRSFPGLSPERTFAMATTEAARAVGLAGRVGELRNGAEADLVLHRLSARTRSEALEGLTNGEGRVAGVWVAGRRVLECEPHLSRDLRT